MPEEGVRRPNLKRSSHNPAKRGVEADLIVKPLRHEPKAADDGRQPAATSKYHDLVPPEDDCLFDTTPDCIRGEFSLAGKRNGSRWNP
jgi:hypothetical protein